MKTFLKIFTTAFLLCLQFGFAQNSAKVPSDAVFYMEVNGKLLDSKINWEKVNPFLNEVNKKEKTKLNWNDFAKTGINYNEKQYHYAAHNDSVTTYTVHFTLDNRAKFLEFVNSSKKEGQEISAKPNYSYIDLDNETFVAWNEKKAVLKYVKYKKPRKWEENDYSVAVDSAVAVVDSAAVAVDSAAEDYEEGEKYEEEAPKPFDYKEEIKYLKDEIKYLKEGIKDNQKQIAEIQKNIKYLEKNHKYPKDKDPYKEENEGEENMESADDEVSPPTIAGEEEEYEPNSDYKREMDSINLENFKLAKNISETFFDAYFNSNQNVEADAAMLSFKDENADVFLYTNFGNLYNDLFSGRYNSFYNFQQILGKAYQSDSFYNIYFDKDKVRLVNNYLHKDAEIQKSIAEIYKGRKNKKLASLVSENSIGSVALNINTNKYFDLVYGFFKNNGNEQREIDLFVETMKIVLDEKAIAELAPGNGIFILNDLKKKKVEYTDFEYDDDYNENKITKTKEVTIPDFTFAFSTKNEGYWNRIFEALLTNKYFGKNLEKFGNIYSFKENNNKEIDKMFFTVKDEIVYFTTSIENLDAKNTSGNLDAVAKESTKHAMYGKINLQKLLIGFEDEAKSTSDKKMFDYFKNNVGQIIYKTDAKKNSIETEMIYQINNQNSENSIMHFFDMFRELYKDDLKKVETVH